MADRPSRRPRRPTTRELTGPRLVDTIPAQLHEWNVREAWFTPGPVVEQGLHAARIRADVRPQRIIDLGSGPGVFGQRCDRVWAGTDRLGIEVRRSERRHMARHYHEPIIADMFERRADLARFGADLVVSNPPYTLALKALQLALSIVRLGGWVLFFVRSTFNSSAKVWRWLMENPPRFEFSVAGRPNMRVGKSAAGNTLGGDMVGHTWLLFRRSRAQTRPVWPRELLPQLDRLDLSWRVRPGTELHVPSFPDLYLPLAA